VWLLAADAARNELVVIRERAIFDAAEILERSALLVALVQRALGLAEPCRSDVVAFEDLVPGFNALGMRLAAALVDRLSFAACIIVINGDW
jgi:hypothetical protein